MNLGPPTEYDNESKVSLCFCFSSCYVLFLNLLQLQRTRGKESQESFDYGEFYTSLPVVSSKDLT